jgi:ABC-type phosphate transport system substrate-binding protein
MRRRWWLSIGGVIAALGLGGGPLPAQEDTPFVVVVHDSNPEVSMPASRVSSLFLKKVTRWADGEAVEPIDLASGSTTRVEFSQRVHGKDVEWVESYWNKLIFSGRGSPPPEVRTDAEVLAFVSAHPRAIGYVSSGTQLGSGVRAVAITD